MEMTSNATSPLIDLPYKDNEVTVTTRCSPTKLLSPSFPTSGRKPGAITLTMMREWLELIIEQPSTDFGLRGSEQAKAFDDKQMARFQCTMKTAKK